MAKRKLPYRQTQPKESEEMFTKTGTSLCTAIIISYLKYKRKVDVKELLFAYDCIKYVNKIDDKLPIIVEKICQNYQTFLNIGEHDYRNSLSQYMHYAPHIAGGVDGLLFLETLSKLEKANLIITNLSESIEDILKKEAWEFPSIILNSEILITEKWDINQNLFDINLVDILEDAHMLNPIRFEPRWHLDNELKTDVFVIMPFDDKMKPIFNDHIAKVCDNLKLSVTRADDLFAPTTIIDDIWSLIFNSKIIICDCTGKNPNVFYELGMAHTSGKEVIIITQNQKDIPFDIKHIRYIHYAYTPPGMSKFETALNNFITEILKYRYNMLP